MWFNSRRKMTRGMQLFRLCLIIVAFSNLANTDKSTIERIKKHQEWLKQRSQRKPVAIPTPFYQASSNEMTNLWRFPKKSEVQQPSMNDVYPENEAVLALPSTEEPTTTTTATTTTSTSTPATTTATTTTTKMPTTTTTTTLRPSTELPPVLVTMPTTRTTAPTFKSTTSRAIARSIFNMTMPTLNSITTTNAPSTSTTSMTTTTTTTSTTTQKPKPKTRPYPRWGNWSKWSVCSRSCGGGVMFQQRKCINRNSSTGKRYLSNNCIGVYIRYHLCNEQACPAPEKDFRAEQCVAFNEVDFQGHKYTWEPYLKDDAECELNCKPLGMKYFATLNATVIDGTPCYRPAEYYRSNYRERAICVGGICKAIHASGVITGLSANSGSVGCGGLICRPFTGIFTRDPLPEDAYVHVATIPAGASNISITELKNSINLLVLRTSDQKYLFNSDNAASESGAYEAAGAIFDYHRIDGIQHGDGVTEWITCTGPIKEMLELMIYSKSVNPGVKYEYLLPIASDSEENELSLESDGFLKAGAEDSSVSSSRSTRRRKFNWKVVGFSSCTKSCGGGTQVPIVRCVRENPVRYFSQRRCVHSEKPVLNENLLRCNTQPCPAYWRLDDWGDCRCHQGEGYREREVSCVQELASGIVIHVDNSACMEEQPPPKKPCDCPKNRRRVHARYRTSGASLAGGVANNSAHAQRQRERAGVWLTSDWNQYCSVDCGAGVEYRTIFCDRSKPNAERCDSRATPEITRPCEHERACETGDWFAGPWSPCNGNCFNLTRTRAVLCIQNQLIVEDEDCRPELRPQIMEKCLHEEVEYCGSRWHYSDWSECTKTCDGGTQRRSVKCLEYEERDNTLKDSSKCRYSLREPIYRGCNTHKCDDPRLELLQNDIAVSCVDEFSNCQWAVKAKLCSYEYYQENCCYSCGAP